jgi:hypothetical protein
MTPRGAKLPRQLEVPFSKIETLQQENQLLLQRMDQLTRRFFEVSGEQ